MKGIGRHGNKNLYYNIPMFSCRFVCPTSHARRPGRRICSGKPEGLNEQGRSRDHESSDEGDKTAQCRAGAYAYASPPSPLLCGPSGIRKSTAVPVPGLKTMKIGKASQSRPAHGRPCFYYNPCVVVLRPSSRSFAETRTRVPKNANGIAAHCTETCAELSGVK